MSKNPNEKYTILLIEDEEHLRKGIKKFLESRGYIVNYAGTGEQALLLFEKFSYDIVLSDIKLPGISGMEVLDVAMKKYPSIVFIMMTAFSTIKDAIDAIKKGAYYFLPKPFEYSELEVILRRAVKDLTMIKKDSYITQLKLNRYQFSNIIGESQEMYKVFEIMERVAATDTTVLIQGASGTGKELVAKAIHYNSNRRENIFIAINCSTLNEELLSSELFGYVKGAFTGAEKLKKGLFEVADGGTIFLDEISEIPTSMQVKLLRVLQEGEFIPVGGTSMVKTDVRIIAATNRDLKKMTAEKTLRQDFYYRLMVMPILLPELKDREGDILKLAQYFLEIYSSKLNKKISSLTDLAIEKLLRYNWPGNVRELENVIERAVILEDTSAVQVSNLIGLDMDGIGESEFTKSRSSFDLLKFLDYKQAVSEFKKMYLLHRIEMNNGNIQKTAKELGIHRSTLYTLLK